MLFLIIMSKEKVLSFSASGFTLPQEEVVELRKSNKSLIIGIPKEILLPNLFLVSRFEVD